MRYRGGIGRTRPELSTSEHERCLRAGRGMKRYGHHYRFIAVVELNPRVWLRHISVVHLAQCATVGGLYFRCICGVPFDETKRVVEGLKNHHPSNSAFHAIGPTEARLPCREIPCDLAILKGGDSNVLLSRQDEVRRSNGPKSVVTLPLQGEA